MDGFDFRHLIWRGVVSAVIFLTAYFSLVQDSFSDPKLNFVVSQAIVEHGTIRLDAYQDRDLMGRPFSQYVEELDILNIDGHFYHYFPIGPSVLAVPFVLAANLAGMDMLTTKNFGLQSALAGLSCVVVFWLLVGIGRNLKLTPTAALTSATIGVLGSPLISSLGTAMWSLNWTAIFFGSILYLVTREEVPRRSGEEEGDTRRRREVEPYLIGVLAFLAFFCRASAAAFIAPLFVYLLWRDWRAGVRTAVTAGVLLVGYLVWSRLTFGSWLPAYYSVGRLSVQRAPIWVGIVGNLLSPSRGIFVFSPFLLLLPLGIVAGWRSVWRRPIFWLCVSWFGLHLWLVARAAKWYGGWSFGPRLLADVMVALVVLLMLCWASYRGGRRLPAALFVALGTLAIAIHSVHGLYNRGSARWNAVIAPSPSVSSPHLLGDMFVWRYGQFMAGQRTVCQIEREKAELLPVTKRLELGEWLTYDDVSNYRDLLFERPMEARPVFVGWSAEEVVDFRISVCPEPEIRFLLPELSAERYILTLDLPIQRTSTVFFSINGSRMMLPAREVEVSADLLNSNGLNTITFHLPNLQHNGLKDQRLLGVGFAGLRIEAAK